MDVIKTESDIFIGAFIMRKNQLTKIMGTASVLGVQALALSAGALTLSLGINLAHIDNSTAMAAASFLNSGNGATIINAVYSATASTDKPIVFASEIFGTSSSGTVLPIGSGDIFEVTYVFDGAVDALFDATFTLDNGAKFGGSTAPVLTCSTIGSGDGPATSTASTTNAGLNYNVAKFSLDAKGTPIVSDGTTTGHGYFCKLQYRLANAQALAVAGQKITMTAAMQTAQPSFPVSPSRTVTVAESKDAVSVALLADLDLDDRIAVSSDNKEFTNAEAANTAVIGSLLIKDAGRTNNATAASLCDYTSASVTVAPTLAASNTDDERATVVKDASAKNCFNVMAVDDTKTTFTITDGQFKASVTSPGKVILKSSDLSGSTEISTNATDETTAIFKLTGANMKDLTTPTLQGSSKGFGVKIVADGKTDINSIENPPVGELHIEYNQTTYKDYLVSSYPAVELKKIKLDGTRCVVYNVPAPGSADIVAVRITNDSGVSGIVNATLYDGSGAEIFAAQPLNGGDAIAAGATLAVFNTDLAALGSWSGRGVLALTTTLPSLEVLGLLREAGNNAAPLTNLSTGAMGDGCTN
jgi:hypothetical protein